MLRGPPPKARLLASGACTVQYFGPCIGAFVISLPAMAQTSDVPVLQSAQMNFTGLQFRDTELAESLPIAKAGQSYCVDLNQFAAAFKLQVSVDVVTRSATGQGLTEADTLEIDFSRQKIAIAGKPLLWESGFVQPIDNGLCVSLEVLKQWLPVTFNYDPFGSLLIADSDAQMPFEEEEARLQRREELSAAEESIRLSLEDTERQDYAWFNVPTLAISASAGLGHGDGTTTTAASYSVAAIGEMLKMTSEAILISDQSLRPSNLRATLYRQDPYGGVFGVPQLSEVSVGDVVGTGSALLVGTGSGRGISLSSYPSGDADEYDRTTFQGALPVGWEAELYRNNVLVNFQQSNLNGFYEFRDIPVLFGNNDFKIILYGPQGQRETRTKTINSSGFVVPRGKVYGRFSLLQLDKSLFEFKRQVGGQPHPVQFGGDVKIGVAENVSAGAGFSSFVRDNTRYWYGSLSAQANLGPVQTDAAVAAGSTGGVAGQIAANVPLGNGGLRLRYSESSPSFNTDRISSGTRRTVDLGIDQAIPYGTNKSIPLSLSGSWSQLRDGSANIGVTAQTGISLANTSLSNSTRLIKTIPASGSFGASATSINGSIFYNTQIGTYSLRGNANYTLAPTTQLESISVSTDRQISDERGAWFVSGAANWSFRSNAGDFSTSLNRQFNKFTASLSATTSTTGSFGINLGVSFSLGRNPAKQSWRVSGANLAQSSSAVVRVFDDVDQDNMFSSIDKLLPDAQITVDGNPVPHYSNDKGLAVVDNLPAYRPINLGIDNSQMENVDLIPSRLINSVMARPGTMSYTDLPMTMAGGVDGEIQMITGSGPPQPLPGIPIQIVSTNGGVTTSARSGYDGFYIVEKLPVGDYNVLVAPEILQRLNADMTPRFVQVTRSNPFPSGITIRLRRKNVAYVELQSSFDNSLISSNGSRTAVAPPLQIAAGNRFEEALFDEAGAKTLAKDLQLVALFGEELIDVPLPDKAPVRMELVALFGDDIMDLPLLPAPPKPPTKLPTPTIVVINPRFDDTLDHVAFKRNRQGDTF